MAKVKGQVKKKRGPVLAEYERILVLDEAMSSLLSKEVYIAKRDYSDLYDFKEDISFFKTMVRADLLKNYCKKNAIKIDLVNRILETYDNIEALVEGHNDRFIEESLISEKEYFDNLFKEADPNILLDEDQRRAVLTDEDNCLIIAGAGAGKTTTVAAKVKYLVEKKKIDPRHILVISFTNKAVDELKKRLNHDLKIDCPTATFHSTGNAILRKKTSMPLRIYDSSNKFFFIRDYFRKNIMGDQIMVDNLTLFFSSYFSEPEEFIDIKTLHEKLKKTNNSTIKSELNEYKDKIIDKRQKKKITIQNEVLRSQEEVAIANYLYLNGIDYEYEPLYQYNIHYAHKPYTPDFLIRQDGKSLYLEHFGISEDGKHSHYDKESLERYKRNINDKIRLHRSHDTKLIYTFSSYKDGRPFIKHLEDKLLENGFILSPKSNSEVINKIVSDLENRYFWKLLNLLSRFISNFKTNGFGLDDFDRMYYSTSNVRTRLLLNLCKGAYIAYQAFLKEEEAVDFEDMINESARLLREVKDMNKVLDFEYIIVDEYQDISRQRYDLISALSEVTRAKIIAVGDDWQSIYAFSGSDITLFTNFAQKVGYAKEMQIRQTYRNAQEIIDIAGSFIKKNASQISKDLKSNKRISCPIIIYTYKPEKKKTDENWRSGVNYAIANGVDMALRDIHEFNMKEGKKDKDQTTLILGRFNFDGYALEKSGLFRHVGKDYTNLQSHRYPKFKLSFMSAHSSKGLGYDNVIIINGKNEIYGFPAKIEDDPVLRLVIKEDDSILHAEERRLFYVAMTRTKNRVFFIAPERNPSEFLLEIHRDYENVLLKGKWNDSGLDKGSPYMSCPNCGYPMQYRYKNAYGLRLYLCMNEPEVCGFMTNDLKGEKLPIMKCSACRDGYLVVKRVGNSDECFLGCTNYKKDKTGCNKSMSKEEVYEQFELVKGLAKPKILKSGMDISIEDLNKRAIIQKDLPKREEIVKKLEIDIKEEDLIKINDLVHTILQALSRISSERFYGLYILRDFLVGSKSKKVLTPKLNLLAEYGSLKHINRLDLVIIIEELIKRELILQTKGRYPQLHPTHMGLNYSDYVDEKWLRDFAKSLKKENISI